MIAFIKKYKWKIVYWIILLFVVLYFAPDQNKYYLDDDIKNFKTRHLQPVLVYTGIITPVGFFIYRLINTRSVKQAAIGFAYLAFTLACLLFIFRDVLLGASLFLNRQFKKSTVQKLYQATYLAGGDHAKKNFVPYDLATKQISIDNKLINKLYSSDLSQNDTIRLNLEKGIFGIDFSAQPLNNK
ncbi:hypothetical protein [Ferruginibacter sp.]